MGGDPGEWVQGRRGSRGRRLLPPLADPNWDIAGERVWASLPTAPPPPNCAPPVDTIKVFTQMTRRQIFDATTPGMVWTVLLEALQKAS